jgi:hypothetical protein
MMAAPPLAGGATPIVRSDVVMKQLQVSRVTRLHFPHKSTACVALSLQKKLCFLPYSTAAPRTACPQCFPPSLTRR